MKASTHRELEAWLREGRREPMAAELGRHLDACSSCRAALDELDELRSWFPDETPEIAPDAAAAIRFRLQAEARTRSAGHGVEPPTMRAATGANRRLWLVAAAAAAVAVVTVGGVAGALVWLGRERDPSEATHVSTRSDSSGDARNDARRGRARGAEPPTSQAPAAAAPSASADVAPPIAPPAPSTPISGATPSDASSAASAHLRHAPSSGQHPAVNRREHADVPSVDRAFHEAWQLRRAGRNDEAARAFDALLARRGLGARRADVLYWSARAHEASGRRQLAVQRLEKLVRAHPRAWHAADGRRRLEAMRGE